MYVFGGSTGGALEDFHRLDLVTGTWSSINNSSPPLHLGVPSSRGDTGGRNGGSSGGVGIGGVMSALGFQRSDARSVSESFASTSSGGGIGSSNEAIVERPISSPGSRFCHIAVVQNGCLYSFGGYDGSRRLNDFLKYSFTSDLTASDIPVSTLVDDLKGFVKSDLHSDITFIVEGRKIHAHKILCMRCAFFHNMLTGEYMESREAEIEIAELTYDTFSSLIEFLYSDHCEVNRSNAMELFQAADRFGIDRLKKVCECVLATHLEVEGVSEMALAGDRYNGDILKGESLSFIVSHFDAVSKTKGFEEMGRANADLLFEILRLR
jgi:BTB/POZ domain/Kelch motif/Galactose oxidase, central domain